MTPRHLTLHCGQCSCFYSTDNTGDEFAASGSGWDSMSIRHAFIRKVKHTLSHKPYWISPQPVCHVLSLHLSRKAKLKVQFAANTLA